MKFQSAFSEFEKFIYGAIEQQWQAKGLTSPVAPAVDWKGYQVPDWVDMDRDIVANSPELALLDEFIMPDDIPSQMPAYAPNTWMALRDGKWVKEFPADGCLYVLDIETNLLTNTKMSETRATYSVAAWNCNTLTWYVYQGDGEQRLYPFSRNNVIIGHNVQYDRGYCATEYENVPTGNSWLCTMSLFIQLRGVSNKQQDALDFAVAKARHLLSQGWMCETAEGLGLADVYQFYTRQTLDKSLRDSLLVAGSLASLRPYHSDIIEYNFKDVLRTSEVYQHMHREWVINDPNPISRLGLLQLSRQRLPIDQKRLSDWCDASETLYQQELSEKTVFIQEAFDTFIQKYVVGKDSHPQIPLLDNTPAKTGVNKGMPAWSRKIKNLTIHSHLTPVFLELEATMDLDNPCYELIYQDVWVDSYGKSHKCYRTKSGWLMNPAKPGTPIQSMFCKDALPLYETEQVVATSNIGKDIVKFLKETSTYVSLRKRLEYLRNHIFNGYAMVTNLNPGTISGRCSHKLYQVMPNTKPAKLGTELKHLVDIPLGFSRVGADFDSQEAVIAAILADMATGNVPMGNMFSQMVLCGDKKKGTTPHLLIQEASRVGDTVIDYTICKNIFYAGCYHEVNNMHHFQKAGYADKKDMKLAHSRVMTLLYGSPDGKCTGGGGLLSPLYETQARISKGACRTLLLNRCVTKTLHGYGQVNTKANWVIQAVGADMLRLLVSYVTHIAGKVGIPFELMITVHDEASFICRQSDHQRLIAIMQIAHSMVWARLFKAAGLSYIPEFRYFYSQVEVDTTWRKDIGDTGVTKHNRGYWDASPMGSYSDYATQMERKVGSYSPQDVLPVILDILNVLLA